MTDTPKAPDPKETSTKEQPPPQDRQWDNPPPQLLRCANTAPDRDGPDTLPLKGEK